MSSLNISPASPPTATRPPASAPSRASSSRSLLFFPFPCRPPPARSFFIDDDNDGVS